jgi:hypothetical protein
VHRLALLASFALLLPAVGHSGAPDGWLSRSGYYRVSYTSKLNPVVINRIHAWVIHVESADGKPVEGAKITLTGGMPAHNHGLPTAPTMTAELGGGDYQVEGIRFHMAGYWELRITVDADGRRDTVIIPLTI